MHLTLKIENYEGKALSRSSGNSRVNLVHNQAYQEGDHIILETDSSDRHLVVRLEDSMPPTFVFMGGNRHKMSVPFGEKLVSYSPKSFRGETHLLFARCAEQWEVSAYKNLALNPFDCHENTCLFPHASANVETRGESVFAARNAIDGIFANANHGPWPYQSWGINHNPRAEMRIQFGREIYADKAVLITRADFPHDSWWTEGTIRFSDGGKITFPLTKTDMPQIIEFKPRKCEWILFGNLIKADDSSPFPALTQIEIWGTEA